MDRIVFFFITCLLSCQNSSLPNDALFTMLNRGSERLLIARYPDRGGFTSGLFVLQNDLVTDSTILGSNDFFKFISIKGDTVFIQRLIQTTQQDAVNFAKKDTVIEFGQMVLSVSSYTYFGAGAKGLKNCEILTREIKDTSIVLGCSDGLREYNLANVYFTDNAIYYYELKDGVLKNSFLGYQKKIHLSNSP